MTNTYLFDIIRSLTPEEREEIRIYLSCELFVSGNASSELKHLYQLLMADDALNEEALLSKERIYEQIFPGEKIVAGKLEKIMVELNKYIRTYLLIRQYLGEDRQISQQIEWASWLRKKGMTDRSRQVLAKVHQQKNQGLSESLEKYRLELRIVQEEHELESMQNQGKGDLNIPVVMEQLDKYYFNYRIELENRYLLQQKATTLPQLISSEQIIFDINEKNNLYKISSAINAVLKKEQPTEQDIKILFQMLLSNESLFSFQTLTQYFTFLRNSCTLLINNGHLEFIPILHQIHKENLEKGYFFINGELSPHAYTNIVQIAIRAEENNWAIEFTEAYRQKIIGGDEGSFFYKMNLAYCLFAKGKFDEALEKIPDAPSNIHYHQTIRRLELKIYYETKSDLLLYKIDAFRKYLQRTAPKNLAEVPRELNLNFLNILLQLAQSPPKDKARSAKLVARIEGKKLIADRLWLLEKARELG